MATDSRAGQSLEILEYLCNDIFRLDEDVFERILLDSRVCNSKVMIVSVGGNGRSGNSFLLNIFLKYLRNPGKHDWMDNPSDPLEGFQWGWLRVGCKTNSICMWNEPFFITTPSGEEVCVLLMDTPGEWLSKPGSANVLLFKSLFASVQISSQSCRINFEWWYQYVVDYGKLALQFYGTKPFQTLFLLIRGGLNHPFGFKGGEDTLKRWLKNIKLAIPECFEDLKGFILPCPGDYVKSKSFSGLLSDEGINPEFKTCLKILTEHLFDPKNLVIKEINGKQVTGWELFHYFKSYDLWINSFKALEKDRTNPWYKSYDLWINSSKPLEKDKTDPWYKAFCKAWEMIHAKDNVMRDVPQSVLFALTETSKGLCLAFGGLSANFIEPRVALRAAEKAREIMMLKKVFAFQKPLEIMEMTKEKWNEIAMDKSEDFYNRKMKELFSSADMFDVKIVHGVYMCQLNYLVLKAHHEICYELTMKKLRRLGVVNKVCEDGLKVRLLKIYADYMKDFQDFMANVCSSPSTTENVNERSIILAVSDKKEK